MKLDIFVTSTVLVLRKRQNAAICPAECYSVCNEASVLIQTVGLVPQLCAAGSEFQLAYSSVRACVAAYAGSSSTTEIFPELQTAVDYCAQNGDTSITVSASSSDVASYFSSVESSGAYCASYFSSYGTIATNCTTAAATTTPVSSSSSSSTSSDTSSTSSHTPTQSNTTSSVTSVASTLPSPSSSGPTPRPTASPTPVVNDSNSNAAAIGGGVGGGVGGTVLIIVVGWFALRRRRKKPAPVEDTGVPEKAQLHSNDIKPDRKELEGTKAAQNMLEKRATDVSELPANEEVIDKHRSKEMPSNEPAGHEMETTENEMAALDRMARLTDSTTLGSGNTKSEGPPA